LVPLTSLERPPDVRRRRDACLRADNATEIDGCAQKLE
jgi:hypothetical protein